VKDIDVLQKLQNKALKTILRCDWYTHSKYMLKELDWLSIKQPIQIKALKFVHGVVLNDRNNVFTDMY
jgi:hypothetical protein